MCVMCAKQGHVDKTGEERGSNEFLWGQGHMSPKTLTPDTRRGQETSML